MQGLMMDYPLTIRSILERAAKVYPQNQIVSQRTDGSVHRQTYADLYLRVVRLMNALRALDIRPGDRVATFAFNSHAHLELYFAVPCLGAILHTLNIRLPAPQVRYLIGHAEDRLLFVDRSLLPRLAEAGTAFPTVQRICVMEDGEAETGCPFPNTLAYESLLQTASDAADFPRLEENTAAGLGYTSGTTGDPKGVLYSHRSTYLHAMGVCMADSLALRERETVLPVVPMFHANAWGLPYGCALTGAKQVLPGARLLAEALVHLIVGERVTISAGVPTVWNLLYQHLRQHPCDLSCLHTLLVGGTAMPAALIAGFERDFGITVLHAWGMTEMSPVGTVSRLRAAMQAEPPECQLAFRAKQGIPVPGVEARICTEQQTELPWNGRDVGELQVRGPWVTRAYYRGDENDPAFTQDGWFCTGDIATIDAYGAVEITDRKKDLIKSRGEWISSVEMENLAMTHPGVLEAAVVARPHPVRGETPAIFVRRVEGFAPPAQAQEILSVLRRKFDRWQLPRLSDIYFVDAIPKTSVGKFDKKALRQRWEQAEGR